MNLKEKKYLLLDLDGVCYGKHNNYSLEKVFGQVSNRMTKFISERLKIDLESAKKLQTDYFYKYNTSLNGLMIHHNIPPDEFLEYVHTIDISFMKVLAHFIIDLLRTYKVVSDWLFKHDSRLRIYASRPIKMATDRSIQTRRSSKIIDDRPFSHQPLKEIFKISLFRKIHLKKMEAPAKRFP